MVLGRVAGTMVASRKEPTMEGLKFLVVRHLDVENDDLPSFVVAADAVGAGVGEVVSVHVIPRPHPMLEDVLPIRAREAAGKK